MSRAHQRARIEFTIGPFAEQVCANGERRLRTWLSDSESEPLRLFKPEARALATTGEWYGEHAGKWLLAACRRFRWSADEVWGFRIESAAEALLACQESSGYLGTYPEGAGRRFTEELTADGRTWDLWVNAYAMLGLLEAAGAAKRDEYAAAAESIGSLVLRTFGDDPARLLEYGNHQGLSALVVLEPLAILARRAGGERFAEFAMGLVEAAEEKLGLLSSPIDRIGTGKIYQLLWVLDGLACLAQTTSDDQLLEAVIRHWKTVQEHHLSPIGGPWGGVAGHKEVFNPPHFFDPSGLIETCSVMSWMSLSRRLFALTRGQQYLDAYHRSLWNVLLGAADPNGEDWIYFSFPNGQRNATYHWACCRSSGALALEDAADFAVEESGEEVIVNLVMPLKGSLGGTEFELQVSEDWQEFRVIRQAGSRPIRVRLPSFAGGGDRLLPSEDQAAEWTVPQPVRPLYQAKHLDHHGQTIVHDDYVAVERGPYVYAAGLIEGYRKQETLRIPRLNASDHFRIAGAEEITLILAGHAPIKMEPYYKAGGRGQGTWRAVWLQAAWQ